MFTGADIQRNCPLDNLFRLLAGEWTPHVIWALGTNGSTRFGNLQRFVGRISPKVLTERLRKLEDEGVLIRHQEKTVPPKVTYTLTEKGMALHAAIKAMEPVANVWFASNGTTEI